VSIWQLKIVLAAIWSADPHAYFVAITLLAGAADGELIAAAIRTHACVPTPGGNLARPSDLYDPRVASLLELLDPREHFPASPFDAGERLMALAVLGMRSSLGAEGLVAGPHTRPILSLNLVSG
jgi:hypothetical protein